jgi:predicted  nucleic acid-binding Zn-ribbon protein
MSIDEEQLNKDVFEIKSDLAQFSVLVERIDTASEKLAEVSTNITRLIAILETRLDQQEKVTDELTRNLEKRRAEREASDKEIKNDIYKLRTDFTAKLLENRNAMEHQCKMENVQLESKIKSLTDKLFALEKWKWIISGGIAVVAFILGKFSSFSKFLGV